MRILLKGIGASSGRAQGRVKVVLSHEDLGKVSSGDVLVTVMTNPTFVVAMEKAVAIVTDVGGILSHAAIVAREFGIPCVVGTGEATKILRDGMEVIVDGSEGVVYSPT